MRRGATLVLLGAMLAAVAVATMPRRSFAEGGGAEGYQLVAAADGVRITWSVPGFAAIDSPIDGGGPSAQARLDSLGQSGGFASLPYPGDAFVGLPGLLAGFTGLPAAPDYPFYVSSSHPTVPDKRYEVPGMALSAHSDAGTSVASAAGGQGGDAMVLHPASRAETTRAGDGTLTALATSAVDTLTVGPLRLRGLASTAKVVRTPDGRQEITSSLTAASAAVGDLAAQVNDQGLIVAGTATPIGADPVADALAKAGIRVAMAKAVKTDTGVVAPSLSLTFSQYSEQFQRQVTIRYVLGASSASLIAGAPPGLPASAIAGPGESTGGPVDGALPGSDPSPLPGGSETAGAPSSAALGGLAPSGSAAIVPDEINPPGAGSAPAGRPAATATATATASAASAVRPVASESAGWAWGSLYLVLIAAGLVLAGGVELLRSLGVRKP
jgi:hypothetical protein